MGRIVLSEPEGPYDCTIDTGVMDVKLIDTFLGVRFVADSGEMLSVSMRDNGFEVHYQAPTNQEKTKSIGWFEFKNGNVNRMEKL